MLSTATMLLAIVASTLLLHDRAQRLEATATTGPPRMPQSLLRSMSLRGAEDMPLLIRPALRCDASPRSLPLTPPTAAPAE